MRLAGYLRVSSTGQLDGYGFDVQRADIERWAKANGHKIVEWFTDAVTGKYDAPDRPGLTDAVQMIRRPAQAEGIVVGKLDRLARALTVQEAILALVWREGASVFTAEDGEVQQDDPDDPMRTAIRQVQGVFAELDRKTVVKRLRDGRKEKAKTGRKAVGEYAYGFAGQGQGRERDAAPEPTEQAAVRRIVELRESGASYRVIASTLDAEGHKPRRAAAWSAMAVRNIVQRQEQQSG
ncbi:recombinase family protein [Lentzea flaviverrucosa]|uniref:Site-specific DNA recombinase n=1 Tax=Lentzea flaviverrucosa TaxID=200379 RepID=A0A1H9XNM7_9PSEU|nr:recombinase family protein [Lentzea flaviverrucosa]RDI19666.1 DNA invertase Pin-like site-specific DNA recombinase [Lentzea flaviverrucosa]SES47754.1 Site-specific DNA recombinase [Lentzea flaviverrucosa]